MSEEPRYFPKAPVVEAIFHIEAPGRRETGGAVFPEIARREVDEGEYPEMKPILQAQFEFQAVWKTGEARTKGESLQTGVIFRSADGRRAIQFRADGMSFHRLAPYTSYEEEMPEFQKYWDVFRRIAEPKATVRQGLRFINRIQLPPGVGFESIGEYAKITPAFAMAGELEPMHLLSRVRLRHPPTGSKAYVTFALPEPAADPLVLLFDLDVAGNESLAVDSPRLPEVFGQLRELKNRLFAGSLHEKCLDLFR